MGFEPTREEHIGLAASSSVDKFENTVVRSYLKHVLEPSVVTVWLYMIKSGHGAGAL